MIYLDTSYLVGALVPGSLCDEQIRQWLSDEVELNMNPVAWGEFMCGPLKPEFAFLARELLTSITEMAEADGTLAARLFNDGGRKRGTFADCLIAATTILNGGILATLNRADFEGLVEFGLDIAD